MSSNSGPSRQMRSPAAASSSSSSAAQNQRSQHHQQQQEQQQQRASQRDSSSFTAEMRDRQSRGKDPYVKERPHPDDDDDDDDLDDDEEEEDGDDMDLDDDDEDMDDDGRSRLRIGDVPKNEGFEERERRQFALSVLDSPEQLMMYAQSTNDSIPGQRYRFMSTLCGFDEEQQRRQGRVRRR